MSPDIGNKRSCNPRKQNSHTAGLRVDDDGHAAGLTVSHVVEPPDRGSHQTGVGTSVSPMSSGAR